MGEEQWRDQAWLASARTWIDERVERTGEIEQPHVHAWATVLRVPARGGDVWFKANSAALRHEVAIVERVAARRPDAVPPLLASDATRGWMLMADAGERLREVSERERGLDRWFGVLRLYAGVQLDLADDVGLLVAAGVPDRRSVTLPAAYRKLLEEVDPDRRFWDAEPLVASLCDRLAAFGVPETLQHDDLHDGQVFVRDGRHLILDWGDACVSHPFFTPFRDAYLAQFPGDLTEAAAIAHRDAPADVPRRPPRVADTNR